MLSKPHLPRRVVITGMGITSCLGNDLNAVSHALRAQHSGIRFAPEFAELEFSSQIGAWPEFDLNAFFDRKQRRFMGLTAAYAMYAAQQAIAHAQLDPVHLHNERTGVIAGSGSGSSIQQIEAYKVLQERGIRKINPYVVPKWMASTVSANLATLLGIQGVSYSITAACASSAHCIGNAMQMIRFGEQDVMLCGGAEEIDPYNFMIFDAMGALSSHFNTQPQRASRPFDRDRDGFVMAAGAGMLVLESLEHAQQRNAPIVAELISYASTSDGAEMVTPSGDGARRCMQLALQHVDGKIDYCNAHSTGTSIGDRIELQAIYDAFGAALPVISSTKGLTGHSIGAAGVHEMIYSLLMMQDGFIAGNYNFEQGDEVSSNFALSSTTMDKKIDSFISNSFGFGGTNASLVAKRFEA